MTLLRVFLLVLTFTEVSGLSVVSEKMIRNGYLVDEKYQFKFRLTPGCSWQMQNDVDDSYARVYICRAETGTILVAIGSPGEDFEIDLDVAQMIQDRFRSQFEKAGLKTAAEQKQLSEIHGIAAVKYQMNIETPGGGQQAVHYLLANDYIMGIQITREAGSALGDALVQSIRFLSKKKQSTYWPSIPFWGHLLVVVLTLPAFFFIATRLGPFWLLIAPLFLVIALGVDFYLIEVHSSLSYLVWYGQIKTKIAARLNLLVFTFLLTYLGFKYSAMVYASRA